jgi:uncharacterized membrane protein
MADDPFPPERKPPGLDGQPSELILSPPEDQTFVADTINPAISSSVVRSRSVTAGSMSDPGIQYYGQRETRVHIGPLPDPATLRELYEIYPDAPRILFEEFRAQSAHRREMERAVITNRNTLALRGQLIGGILGGIGLTGSLVVAGLGHGWAGFGIAMTSVSGLVTTFVVGRESQKKERLKKEELRRQIQQGESIEELERTDPPTADQGDHSQQRTDSDVSDRLPGNQPVASPPVIGDEEAGPKTAGQDQPGKANTSRKGRASRK